MSTSNNAIDELTQTDYKYGFVTEIESETLPEGLDEDVIRLISRKKGEPSWLLEWRLKAYGQEQGKRYATLWRTHITTSCRKFDRFGDWFTLRLILRHPRACWQGIHGRSTELADRYWYDID